MEVSDIKISEDGTIVLLDDNNNLVTKNLEDLTKITVVEKITSRGLDFFHKLLFLVAIVFPPIFIYFFYRWYKMYKNRGKKYIFLEFKESKIGGLINADAENIFVTDRAEPNLVNDKLEEIDKVAKAKNILVSKKIEEELFVG